MIVFLFVFLIDFSDRLYRFWIDLFDFQWSVGAASASVYLIVRYFGRFDRLSGLFNRFLIDFLVDSVDVVDLCRFRRSFRFYRSCRLHRCHRFHRTCRFIWSTWSSYLFPFFPTDGVDDVEWMADTVTHGSVVGWLGGWVVKWTR